MVEKPHLCSNMVCKGQMEHNFDKYLEWCKTMSYEIIVFTNERPQSLSKVMEMQTVYYAHQWMHDVSVGTLALNLTLTLVLHPLFLAVFINDAGTLLCISKCPLFFLACLRSMLCVSCDASRCSSLGCRMWLRKKLFVEAVMMRSDNQLAN